MPSAVGVMQDRGQPWGRSWWLHTLAGHHAMPLAIQTGTIKHASSSHISPTRIPENGLRYACVMVKLAWLRHRCRGSVSLRSDHLFSNQALPYSLDPPTNGVLTCVHWGWNLKQQNCSSFPSIVVLSLSIRSCQRIGRIQCSGSGDWCQPEPSAPHLALLLCRFIARNGFQIIHPRCGMNC
jgi:hypothetical protein